MATQSIYTGDGVTTKFSITFPYRTVADIQVLVNEISVPYSLASLATVQLATPPAAGAKVRVARKTPFNVPSVDFQDGAVLTEDDLDNSQLQLFNRIQELTDDAATLTQRAVKVADGDSAPTFPRLAGIAGKALSVDANGQFIGVALGVGNDPSFRTDLASIAGGDLVGFGRSQFGKLRSSAEKIGSELINVADNFSPAQRSAWKSGNTVSGISDQINEMIEFAYGKYYTNANAIGGARLMLPNGRFNIDKPLKATYRKDNQILDDGDLRRLSIEGLGSANTTLIYTGDPSQYALEIAGYTTPEIKDGVNLRMYLSGFNLTRNNLTRTAGGIYVHQVRNLYMEDVIVAGFNLNMLAEDMIGLFLDKVHLNSTNVGLRTRAGSFTYPNIMVMRNGGVSSASQTGLDLQGNANALIETNSFEGNGSDANSNTILYTGGPPEGSVGLIVANNYFEANKGEADINLAWALANDGIVRIEPNTFHRATSDPANSVNHHIKAAVTGAAAAAKSRMSLSIGAQTFKEFGGYVPNAARAAISIESDYVNASVDPATVYPNEASRLQDNGFPVDGHGFVRIAAAIVGAGTVGSPAPITSQWNVASVSHPSEGIYRINYKRKPRSPSVGLNVTIRGRGDLIAYLSNETSDYAEVAIKNAASGAFTSSAFSISIEGLPAY